MKDIILKEAHQNGQHRDQLDAVCSACTKTVMLARGWEASERDLYELDLTDDEVVHRYRRHAQKMSES